MCFLLLLTSYSFSLVNPVANRCAKADYRCCYDETVQRGQSQTSWSKLHHIQSSCEPPPEYNDILITYVRFSLILRGSKQIKWGKYNTQTYNYLLTYCLPMLKGCEQYISSKELVFLPVSQMYSLFFLKSSAEIITHWLLNLGEIYWFLSRRMYLIRLETIWSHITQCLALK